jgi:ribosome maturation factor RimP
MDESAITGQCAAIIEDYLKARNLELVELIHRFEGSGLVLRIIVDKPHGGITIGECGSLNRDIARLLDEKDLIAQSYTLEISSPGLDRPLKSRNDFMRCMNKPVHVFLNEMVDNKMEWEGIIAAVTEMAVTLDNEGRAIELPLSKINWAKQIIN